MYARKAYRLKTDYGQRSVEKRNIDGMAAKWTAFFCLCSYY